MWEVVEGQDAVSDDRIVAFAAYVKDGPNEVTCTRVSCQGWIGYPVRTTLALTSEELPDGAFCSVCGEDVLA